MQKKKILKMIACVMIATSTLSGCRLKNTKKIDKSDENYVINSSRTTEGYTYDWIDFMNISVYGSDGVAYIEVTPKEIKASDFQSDADYIAMKNTLDKLNLSYKAGSNNSASKLTVTPDSNLKAGDVVTFALTTTVDSSLNMNTQEYEFRIPTLSQSSTIDLFGEDDVIFYGLDGTSEVYYEFTKNTSFTDELQKNLIYTIKTDGKVEADKTILDISADLDNTFLKEGGYTSFAMYLSKFGYEVESYSTQKVLHNVATPIDFNTVRTDKVISALFEKIEKAEISLKGSSTLNQIASVQKLYKDTDEYTYYVVYQDMDSEGNEKFLRRQFRGACLNDEIIILSLYNEEQSAERYATEAYDNGEVKISSFVSEGVEEAESTEETENAEESQD